MRAAAIRDLRLHPFVVAAAGLTAYSVFSLVLAGHLTRRSAEVALAFGMLIWVGELARVTLPGDREIAPIAVAGALGYALLSDVGGHPVWPSVQLVVAVTALSSALGALLHGAVGRSMRLDAEARRLLAVATAAVAYRAGIDALAGRPLAQHDLRLVPLMLMAVSLAGVVDLGLTAVDRAITTRSPLFAAVRDETRAVSGLGAAVAVTGVLIALAAYLIGLLALPALVVPLLATQFSFRRFAGIRATYLQTIRALAKIPEVGGYVTEGHSGRVAALALATGRELGMNENELLQLEYAALMHDIGQLSLAEPIPGGSTLRVPQGERRRVAELGAEIIRHGGALSAVAEIVERQADPYRQLRRPADDSLPLASRIIKAASAYDDLVSAAHNDPSSSTDALERLRLGMAYEYDPAVVEALARVVPRMRPRGTGYAISVR